MKYAILGLLVTILGCAKPEPCEKSAVLGTWDATLTLETLSLAKNCTFASDACASGGTYSNVEALSGTATISITSTGGAANCLSKGDHSCVYTVNTAADPDTLSIACDGGPTALYRKE